MKNKDRYLRIYDKLWPWGLGFCIFALIYILILIAWKVVIMVNEPEPTPTLYEFPTVAAGATIEPSPTHTAPPTATDTQEPTKTPVPTATADIEATAQAERVAVYLEVFEDLNQTAHVTTRRFNSTFGQFIEGKVSVNDPIWQGEIDGLLGAFDGHVAQLRGITPPAGWEAAHDMVLYGMEQCAIGWKIMFKAAKADDVDTYQNGVRYLSECNESWSEGENMIANLRR